MTAPRSRRSRVDDILDPIDAALNDTTTNTALDAEACWRCETRTTPARCDPPHRAGECDRCAAADGGVCPPCLEDIHAGRSAPVGTAAYWADVDEADARANLPNRPAPPGSGPAGIDGAGPFGWGDRSWTVREVPGGVGGVDRFDTRSVRCAAVHPETVRTLGDAFCPPGLPGRAGSVSARLASVPVVADPGIPPGVARFVYSDGSSADLDLDCVGPPADAEPIVSGDWSTPFLGFAVHATPRARGPWDRDGYRDVLVADWFNRI